MTVKQYSQVDEHTLNLLPVAVILFDLQRIYFLNKKAVKILDLPSSVSKNPEQLSVFKFIDKKYHAEARKNIKSVLATKELQLMEVKAITSRSKEIYIEASSNLVEFKGKKVVQTTFCEISTRKTHLTQGENAIDLLQKISANS